MNCVAQTMAEGELPIKKRKLKLEQEKVKEEEAEELRQLRVQVKKEIVHRPTAQRPMTCTIDGEAKSKELGQLMERIHFFPEFHTSPQQVHQSVPSTLLNEISKMYFDQLSAHTNSQTLFLRSGQKSDTELIQRGVQLTPPLMVIHPRHEALSQSPPLVPLVQSFAPEIREDYTARRLKKCVRNLPSRKQQTPDERELNSGGKSKKKEKDLEKLAEFGIGDMLDTIVSGNIDDMTEEMERRNLTEEAKNAARDIRRRGKNKVAAQNCRKRKLDQVETLKEKKVKSQQNGKQLDQIETEKKKMLSGLKEKLKQMLLDVRSQGHKPLCSNNCPGGLMADCGGKGHTHIQTKVFMEKENNPW